MAYQNVSTPRFYVNILEWISETGGFIPIRPYYFPGAEIGIPTYLHSIYRTLPVSPTPYRVHGEDDSGVSSVNLPNDILGENSFIAPLGHNIALTDLWFSVKARYYDPHFEPPQYNYELGEQELLSITPVINCGDGSDYPYPKYNGFSIGTFNGTDVRNIQMGTPDAWMDVGSIVIGTFYDMPKAADLSITMSYEYGEANETATYLGGSVSNAMWKKPFTSYGAGASLELFSNEHSALIGELLSRSGRRVWSMKFSYIDDSDLWGSNQMVSNIAEGITTDMGYDLVDIESNTKYKENLLTEESFFAKVWHKTLGGTLPFIFQLSGGTEGNDSINNPDQFAIARFRNNSLKAQQVALNVYDISVVIEEAW